MADKSQDQRSDATQQIQGSCFCKAVSYSFDGPPVLSAYCHCTNCQRLSGCPFVHTVHIETGCFRWTMEASTSDTPTELLDIYTIPSKPHKSRFRCKNCGACVAGYNSVRKRYSVWGAQIEDRTSEAVWGRVKPRAHIFYGTRMLDVRDGLGKWEGYEGTSGRMSDS